MPKAAKKSHKTPHPLSRKALHLSRKEHHNEKKERRKEELNIKQQVKLKKLLWFKDNVDKEKALYSAEDILDLIDRYLHRFDEEIDKANEAKNIKGRKLTGNLKHDYSLNFVTEKEAQDFNTCGLEVPDLMSKKSFEVFVAWNGEPRFLAAIKMSTISQVALNAQISKQKRANEQNAPDEGT